jgi:hypothetical protein
MVFLLLNYPVNEFLSVVSFGNNLLRCQQSIRAIAISLLDNPTPTTQPSREVATLPQIVMRMACSLSAIHNPMSADPSNSPVPTRVPVTGVVCLCRSTILQRECLSVG